LKSTYERVISIQLCIRGYTSGLLPKWEGRGKGICGGVRGWDMGGTGQTRAKDIRSGVMDGGLGGVTEGGCWKEGDGKLFI